MSTSRVSWWPPWSSAWASFDSFALPCPLVDPWESAGAAADPLNFLAKDSFKVLLYPVFMLFHLEVSY